MIETFFNSSAYNFSLREFDTCFWPQWAVYTSSPHTYILEETLKSMFLKVNYFLMLNYLLITFCIPMVQREILGNLPIFKN